MCLVNRNYIIVVVALIRIAASLAHSLLIHNCSLAYNLFHLRVDISWNSIFVTFIEIYNKIGSFTVNYLNLLLTRVYVVVCRIETLELRNNSCIKYDDDFIKFSSRKCEQMPFKC